MMWIPVMICRTQVILVKATGRVLKLSQCGIAVENRFAFYDQIHTTGMDSEKLPTTPALLRIDDAIPQHG